MPSTPGCPLQKVEVLLLALVLVAAYHAIPYGLLALLPTKALYDRVGENGFGYFWNGLTLLMPLLLCIGAPARCGLRVGTCTSR